MFNLFNCSLVFAVTLNDFCMQIDISQSLKMNKLVERVRFLGCILYWKSLCINIQEGQKHELVNKLNSMIFQLVENRTYPSTLPKFRSYIVNHQFSRLLQQKHHVILKSKASKKGKQQKLKRKLFCAKGWHQGKCKIQTITHCARFAKNMHKYLPIKLLNLATLEKHQTVRKQVNKKLQVQS